MKILHSDKAPAAVGPYAQGVEIPGLIFTSGQLPINPENGLMPTDAAAQAEQCLRNVAAVLEAAGSGLEKAVKMTIFLKNMDDFAAVNTVYASFFQGRFPARSCVEVARLPKDALVEIEAVAMP